MTGHHQFVPSHWNYFLCLDEDVERLSRWIEFSPANEKVYSIELARLLMTASAEADVVAKLLCLAIDPISKASAIGAYQEKLMAAFPTLSEAKVSMHRYGMTLQPWSNWSAPGSPPDWWTSNNKVKHHRSESFSEANLKNVLNSVAGLMILLLLYYQSQRMINISPIPRLFDPHSFAARDGENLILLYPSDANVPWRT